MLLMIEQLDGGSYEVKSETNTYIIKRMNQQSHWGMWNKGDEHDDGSTLYEAPTERDMIGHAVIDLNR